MDLRARLDRGQRVEAEVEEHDQQQLRRENGRHQRVEDELLPWLDLEQALRARVLRRKVPVENARQEMRRLNDQRGAQRTEWRAS